MSGTEPDQRRLLRRMALSIGFSTMPFGIAFGVACAEAGLRWWEAMGFSLLVLAAALNSRL